MVDVFGAREVTEAVFSPISRADTVWQMVPHEIIRGLREQDLPTMPGREESGDAVEGRAEVVGVAVLGHTRMEGHADP